MNHTPQRRGYVHILPTATVLLQLSRRLICTVAHAGLVAGHFDDPSECLCHLLLFLVSLARLSEACVQRASDDPNSDSCSADTRAACLPGHAATTRDHNGNDSQGA